MALSDSLPQINLGVQGQWLSRTRSVEVSRPGATEDPPCKGGRCTLNLNVLPLVWCGSSEREGPTQMSSSSLDLGSKW
ncbi:hypothetical protein TNCV_4928511 [Trichonephila clavipes]|nr:hypothetical protein TNCV_4928511 [Trichonephila clavipes]